MSGTSHNSTTPDISPDQGPEAPVYARLRVVLNYMSQMGKQMSGEKNPKLGIFNKIMSEMMKEVTEYPPAIVELYLKQFAGLVFWVADGDVIDGVEFPPGFTASVPKTLETGDRYSEIQVKPGE